MKKLVMLGFLLGLAYPVQAGECPGEMSVGFNTNNKTSTSLDMLWRTKKVVWGAAVGNSKYSGFFKKTPIVIKSVNLTALVGYWSNQEKKYLLGRHAYIGIGISSLGLVSSEKFAAVSDVASHAKIGLGLDLYLKRNPKKYSLALTTEIVSISQTVRLRDKANSDDVFYKFQPNSLSIQFGARLWF